MTAELDRTPPAVHDPRTPDLHAKNDQGAPLVYRCSECGDSVQVPPGHGVAVSLAPNPCGCASPYNLVGPYGLNEHAIATLKSNDLTAADWVRIAGWGGTWTGDVCGCTDPRCANGFHHMGEDDCQCLNVLIAQHYENPAEKL